MKTKETRYAWIYRNVTALLMILAVIVGLNSYFQMEVSFLFLFVGTFAFTVLAMVIGRFGKRPLFWIVLGAALVITAVTLEITHAFGLTDSVRTLIQKGLGWVRDAYQWFLLYWAGEPEVLLELPYVVFFAFGGLAACTLVLYPLSFHTYTRIALAVLSLAGIVILTVLEIEVGKLPLFCLGLCAVSALIELVNLQFDRHRVETKRSAALFLYPVSVLLILTAVLLPSRAEPIRWQPVRDFVQRMSVNWEIFETNLKIFFDTLPEDFALTFNGMNFTEEGSIDVNQRTVLMQVSTNGLVKSKTYLRGNTNSTYTGSGWVDTSEAYFGSDETEMEYHELLYSMYRSGLMPERNEDIYKRSTLNITFDDIITKTLLYAPHIAKVETGEKDPFRYYGPHIQFTKLKKIGLTYSITYFETNWGSPTLAAYLNDLNGFRYVEDDTDVHSLEAKSGSAYQELLVSMPDPREEVFSADIAQLFADRASTIREVYTGLPDTVPQRVYDLAEEITAGCDTDYEKIKAIEEYFQEGFTYTLVPPVYTDDRDFTDWFLFDSTEGYCTYYATAAAVLARCVGLPSRYIEGVVVGEPLRSGDIYEVTNREAHAWTEVYLEGYGWIPLEPTPGYNVGRETEWARRSLGGGAPEIPEMPVGEEEAQLPVEPVEIIPGPSAEELAALEALRQAELRRFWTLMSIGAVAFLLIAAVVFIAVFRNMRAKRYNRGTNNEKIRILMGQVLRYIASTGTRIRLDETLLEYSARVGLGFDSSGMRLIDAVRLFMRIRYSKAEATRMEVIAMYRYTRELRWEISKQQSLWQRFVFTLRQYVG